MVTRVSLKYNGTVVFSTEIETEIENEFEIITSEGGSKISSFYVIV